MSSYRTPELLKMDTKALNEKAVQKRVDFVNLLRTRGIQSLIKRHIGSMSVKVPCWLGGSQSWEQWEQQLPKEAHLTELQKVSMMAGNADVFFASNDVQGCKDVMKQVYPVAEAIQKECDALLADAGYKVRLDTVGFKVSKGEFVFDPQPTAYELFPAYVLNLVIQRKAPKASTVRTRRRNAEDVAAAADLPFDDKLLVYFEVFHMPNVNLETFSTKYLTHDPTFNINYLSALGLITFSLMIGVTRLEKGFDVDAQRRMAFFTSLVSHTKDKAYANVRDTYTQLFKNSPLYDDEYVYKLNMEVLRARSSQVDALIETFEEWLIERLRPSINAFIVDTNKRVMQETNDRAFMFIAGGDAMRRYKRSISTTKDIDTKIYVDASRKRNHNTVSTMEKKVATIVEECMSKLVYYLGTNKQRLFGTQENDLLMMSKEDNGVMAKMQFYTNNMQNMQFRLRQIEKNDHLPVTLFSIDYRGYMTGTIDGVKFMYKHEIPILDVVIEDNVHSKTRKDIVQVSKNDIPVASMKFLLSDLVKTYNTEHLAMMRVWGNKKKKDAARFAKLREIYKQRMDNMAAQPGSQSGSKTIMGTKVSIDAVDSAYDVFAANAKVDWYINMFHDIRIANKKKKFKHKMPFDFDKIMHDTGLRRPAPPKSPSSSSPYSEELTRRLKSIRL
jgi:hypothetical protein